MFRHLHRSINIGKLIAWQAQQTTFSSVISKEYKLGESQVLDHHKVRVRVRNKLHNKD